MELTLKKHYKIVQKQLIDYNKSCFIQVMVVQQFVSKFLKKMLAELLEVESWGSESKKRYALKLEEC